MGPLASIITCFRKIITYSGRASRSEFWWFLLFLVVLSSVIQTVVASEPGHLRLRFGLNFYVGTDSTWSENLFTVICLPPFLAVLVRRLHDVSRPGYQALIGFVALAALLGATMFLAINAMKTVAIAMGVAAFAWLIYIFVILAKKSHPENRYGPSP